MQGSTSANDIGLATADSITKLEEQVVNRLGGQIRDFQLEVGDYGLILRGRAFTYYAKHLAQHAVMKATALPIQANEIDVI